jgi:medium-chain acyl-[acyl-carrier-protein] hydrolase
VFFVIAFANLVAGRRPMVLDEPRGVFHYPIRGTEADWSGRLQLPSLFSLMQESAVFNAEDHGWGAETLDPLGISWVLLRVSVRMDAFPRWRDVLCVETWPRSQDRMLFHRDFRFHLPGGEGGQTPLGGATTSWVLVDSASHRPRRPTSIPYDRASSEPDRHALGFDAPAIAPVAGLCDGPPAIVKYADACDIDRNLHVNNTRYVAWCVDAVNRSAIDYAAITGIDINYLSEVKFGQKVQIFVQEKTFGTDSAFMVEGREAVQSTAVFRAVLHTCKKT